MNTNYQKLSEDFFDRLENEIAPLNSKCKKIKISLAACAGATFIFTAFADSIGRASGTISFIAFIGAIVSFILLRVFGKKVKLAMNNGESKYYDEVYAPIIASEIGGTAESYSYKHYDFKKKDAEPGVDIKSRKVSITGVYNGKSYSVSDAEELVVDSILYEKSSKKVVSYTPKIERSGMTYQYTLKHQVPTLITLVREKNAQKKSLFKRHKDSEYVQMDDTNFNFKVECNDELAAYKYLTADVMNDLRAWDEKYELNEIKLVADEATVTAKDRLIDMFFEADFYKDMSKNRKKYSGEIALERAQESINMLRAFIESTPVAEIAE